MPRTRSMCARVVVGTLFAAGTLLITATAASAHVEIEETEQSADSFAKLTFSVPHGCDESPTTKIRIKIPDSIPSATPTQNASWDLEIVKAATTEPDAGSEEGDGGPVSEVVYTAKTPLPLGVRDELVVQVRIPAEAADSTIYFPVVQECVTGSTAWTMLPEPGQDPEELDAPAPSVTVGDVASDEHGHDDEGAAEKATTTAPGTGSDDQASADSGDTGTSDNSNGLAVAGLVAGLVGIGVGGAALIKARRS